MIIEKGKNYLVTPDNWFYGPDGHQYRAVYGPAEVITAMQGLGFNPVRSTNWYVRVGTDKEHVLIAGCQIHYAVRTDSRPDLTLMESANETRQGKTKMPSILYLDGLPLPGMEPEAKQEIIIPHVPLEDLRSECGTYDGYGRRVRAHEPWKRERRPTK